MPNYWVDFSLATNSHAGTKSDPFSYSDANTFSAAHPFNLIFLCKGILICSSASWNVCGNIWIGWQDDVNYDLIYTHIILLECEEIFGIKATGAILLNSKNSGSPIERISAIVANCYLWTTGNSGFSIYVEPGLISQCIFRVRDTGFVSISNNVFIEGCSFYGNIYEDNSSGIIIRNSILENVTHNESGPRGNIQFINCSGKNSTVSSNYSTTNCDFTWSTMPSEPNIDSVDPLIYRDRILGLGLKAPPLRGIVPYQKLTIDGDEGVDYSKALFNSVRTGIGAMNFYNPSPVANFTGTPVTGIRPLSVQFTDTTIWTDSAKSAWLWNFGDGGGSTEQNPLHVYQTPGIYTVSLTITVADYNPALPVGVDPLPISDTETKIAYIDVSASNDMQSESMCLRFATEVNEGIGWSEQEGNSFVSPIQGGAYMIHDENDVERCIIEDDDGNIYEDSTFDRIVNIRPPFTDKADFDGTGGEEISGERWERELTAGTGRQDSAVLDEVSHMQVRPSDSENRGITGYDSNGLRTGQAFGLRAYLDGEETYPAAVINNIPENGDLVFPGVTIEGQRIQYVTTFEASDFRMVENKHTFLIKDAAGSTTEKTMDEYSGQLWFETDKVFHISRSRFLYDYISKKIATGSITKCDGPDAYDDSAIQAAGVITLPFIGSIMGAFDFIFMAPNIVGHPVINFCYSNLVSLCTVTEYTPVICEKVIVGWNIFVGQFTGTLNTGLMIKASAYPFKIFDLRIFNKTVFETGLGVTKLKYLNQYYRDISLNKGNGFLPGYISL
jgi:PKD repeat protein